MLILFAIILAGLFYPALKKKFQTNKQSELPGVIPAPVVEAKTVEWSVRAILFSAFLVVILALGLWVSRNFGYRAGLFPWVIGTPVLILSIIQLTMDIMGKTRVSALGGLDVGEELPKEVVRHRTIVIMTWIGVYYFAIWLLGFILSVPLIVFLHLMLGGGEKKFLCVTLAVAAWAFFYFLFDVFLSLPFPEGWLFSLFH